MIIPGFLAASSIAGHLNNFVSIATATVDASNSATVTFSSIPQGYTHLQIRAIVNSPTSSAATGVLLQLNGDTAANYSRHLLTADGSTVTASGSANVTSVNVTSTYQSATTFFGAVIDILEYTSTIKNKTIRSLSGGDINGASAGQVSFYSGAWNSTAAITSLTFTASASNFGQYTQFALYGVK